jgi:hypothetical protein
MLGFKVSLASAILTFVSFTVGIQFESTDLAYGQISPDVNLSDPNSLSPVDEVLQYCRLVNEYGMNDSKEDITGDLVETGKVGTMYRDWTCEDAKEFDERMEGIGNAFKDLEALSEMEK